MTHHIHGPYRHYVMTDRDYTCDWKIALAHEDEECPVDIDANHCFENPTTPSVDDLAAGRDDYFYLCAYHLYEGLKRGLIPEHLGPDGNTCYECQRHSTKGA